jgi:hypothetical protein
MLPIADYGKRRRGPEGAEVEAAMKPLTSVAEQGLVPVPPMADTWHLQECRRLAMADNIDALSGVPCPQPGTTDQLVTKDDLASIRRDLRVTVLALVLPIVPQWSEIVEGLKRQADAMPLWYLRLLAILAPLAIVGSALWVIAGASIAKHLL